jgi:hypothetical protein
MPLPGMAWHAVYGEVSLLEVSTVKSLPKETPQWGCQKDGSYHHGWNHEDQPGRELARAKQRINDDFGRCRPWRPNSNSSNQIIESTGRAQIFRVSSQCSSGQLQRDRISWAAGTGVWSVVLCAGQLAALTPPAEVLSQ